MESTLQVLNVVVSAVALAISIVVAVRSGTRHDVKDAKVDSAEKAALDMKIKALEGKIDSQYNELTQKMESLRVVVAETKLANSTFEARMLASADKLEHKIDRIQDLVIKALINQNPNE